jgi:6-phosphogluconate dehydrogenase (decarboxylating)
MEFAMMGLGHLGASIIGKLAHGGVGVTAYDARPAGRPNR